MTTPHTTDDERLPGEDELSSLYRKLPPIEPPAALDAAVRRAAAEAVTAPASLRRRARWPVALSSAAALVIAAGLAWRMEQMPSKQDELREAATHHQAQTVAAQEPIAVRSTTAPPMSMQARIAEPPKQLAPSDAYAHLAKAQARRKQATPPPPVVEEASTNPLPAPGLAPSSPPAPPSPPAQTADRDKQADAVFQPFNASAPARKSAAPLPTQAMPAPMAPPMAEQAMAAPAPAIDISFNKADTPEQELQKIRDLFAGNQRNDARKRLADFHRDHPNYELPADLRDQLLQP